MQAEAHFCSYAWKACQVNYVGVVFTYCFQYLQSVGTEFKDHF